MPTALPLSLAAAGTMNLVTTLVNTMEGLLKPENLSNKADQVRWCMCICVVRVGWCLVFNMHTYAGMWVCK